MEQIVYCEDYNWNQYFLTNPRELDKNLYPKQVKVEVKDEEYEELLFAPIEDVAEKIRKILLIEYWPKK